MDRPRPYVTAALLCEKVLQEKDDSLTLMRIADRVQYRLEGSGLPEGSKPIINIQGLVSLKSGLVTGEHVIKIIMERPNGDRKDVASFPVNFLGKDQGQNMILNMGLGVDQDGLYWFDVVFDEEVLTRVPLMVMPLPAQIPQEQKT
jgi:hypothetical protein